MAYSILERVLVRCPVFQIGVLNVSYCEKATIQFHECIDKKTLVPQFFDPLRAERGVQSFIELGAKVQFITPPDGLASIQMMHLKASDLEHKIESLGGSWEKLTLDNGKTLFAIISPKEKTDLWESFEPHLLRLKWKKKIVVKDEKPLEVIITCKHADLIDEEGPQKLFLHSNSASVSFVMLAKRFGRMLGCKKGDVCGYDPGGTWKSKGVASEGRYYNDIVAVYNAVKDEYDPSDVWITSACGGTCAAAYLKSLHHEMGINSIFENGFSDLKMAFVDQESLLVKTVANHYWSALKSRDLPDEDRPLEMGFNIPQLWAHLEKTSKGKIIVVNPSNDQRLKPLVTETLLALVQSVNTSVEHVTYESSSQDPHFDRYLNYSKPTRRVLSVVFKSLKYK